MDSRRTLTWREREKKNLLKRECPFIDSGVGLFSTIP